MCGKCIVLAGAVLVAGLIANTPVNAQDPALVGWWKLDEGGGNIAYDSSGRGVNGTIYYPDTGGMGPNGSAWLQDLERGIVLSFNGNDTTGTYVEAGGIPAMTLTNQFTWMFWCKQTTGGGGENQTMLGNRYGGTASPLQFIKFTPTKFEYYNDDTEYTTSITYPTPLPDGEWVHNAGVKDGASLAYFRNGKKVASSTISKTIDANPFYIGGDPQGERWSGCLSDVRLYERALSEDEVRAAGLRPKARMPEPADGALDVGMPLLRWTPGDTALLHNVYFGTSPDLTEADLMATRSPMAMYYHMPGITPGATYYWRVDEIDKDGVTIYTGDVWSFTAQALTAYHPTPADGNSDVAATPTLTWEPGQGALKHQLYFGDSLDAVTQGAADTDKGILPFDSATFAPGTLEVLTTYYWRVDEILMDGSSRAGSVWSFTTALTVEDFESYNDEEDQGTRIYETWIDGWTNGTGSTVGNLDPPFAERTFVCDGNQAMPLDYNNVNAPFYSEAEREFTPAQDWTVGGATTLALCVRGISVNTPAPLYVALQDASNKTATVMHPDPAIVTTTQWTWWKIPLSDFAGVNCAKVKKMYIGVGDRANPTADGTGKVYIDCIRLTK